MHEREAVSRQLDPGVNARDGREGNAIDGDLAIRVPAQADPLPGDFERLGLDVRGPYLDSNLHCPLTLSLNRCSPIWS